MQFGLFYEISEPYEYTKAIADMDPSFLTFDYLNLTDARLVGDPARCVETARRYAAAGCDLLLGRVQPYRIPHPKVMRAIDLLGEQVSPAIR